MSIKKILAISFVFFQIVFFSFSDDTTLHLKAVFNQKGIAVCRDISEIIFTGSDGIFCVITMGGDWRVYRNFFFMNIETGEVKDFYDIEYNAANQIVYYGMENENFIFKEISDNFKEKIRYVKKIITYNWQTDTHSITNVEEKEKIPDNKIAEHSKKYTITSDVQVLQNFTPVNLDLTELDFFTVNCDGFIIPYTFHSIYSTSTPDKETYYWLAEEEKYITISACILQDDVFKSIPQVINPAQLRKFQDPKDRLDQVFLVYEEVKEAEPYEEAFVFSISTGRYQYSYSPSEVFDPNKIYDRGVDVTRFNASFMDMSRGKPSIWGTPIYIQEGTSLFKEPDPDASVVKEINLDPKKIIVPAGRYEPTGKAEERYINKEYKELKDGRYDYGFIINVREVRSTEGKGEYWYNLQDSEGDTGWVKGNNCWETRDGKKVNPELYVSWHTINDNRVRLRTEPNLNCETLDYLNSGDKVRITDRSEDTQKIDDMEAYWYEVETAEGKTGWVYGAFVDVE